MDALTEDPAARFEGSVRSRYTQAARAREAALCCPVEYDPKLIEAIPREVVERDYGCGDPSRHVRAGDTVLDLGSGTGKICFITSQLVGREGRVIGIDMNEEMLELSRRAAPVVADRIGYANVQLHRARIQDLRLDIDRVEARLLEQPIRSAGDLEAFEAFCEGLRRRDPLVPDASVDIVVSNCVLNLVRPADKPALVPEIHRVLKPGGRIAISDIVSDSPVPEELQADPELWSGCVSGAFQETDLLEQLERVGFYGIRIERWEPEPFRVVQGIEFRSLTVTAVKGDTASRQAEPDGDTRRTVVYRGPWRCVEDDRGQQLRRGERTAVSLASFRALTRGPAADAIIPIERSGPAPVKERTGCC